MCLPAFLSCWELLKNRPLASTSTSHELAMEDKSLMSGELLLGPAPVWGVKRYRFKLFFIDYHLVIFIFHFIHGQVSFWGQCAHPYFLEICGKITYESMTNRIIRISIHTEKSKKILNPPTITGIIHKGIIIGICLLNFSLKRSPSLFGLIFAAICPYPQGQVLVSKK